MKSRTQIRKLFGVLIPVPEEKSFLAASDDAAPKLFDKRKLADGHRKQLKAAGIKRTRVVPVTMILKFPTHPNR